MQYVFINSVYVVSLCIYMYDTPGAPGYTKITGIISTCYLGMSIPGRKVRDSTWSNADSAEVRDLIPNYAKI